MSLRKKKEQECWNKRMLYLLNSHFLTYKLMKSCLSTVKPVLSGHRIKRTVAEVPKFISLIYFK